MHAGIHGRIRAALAVVLRPGGGAARGAGQPDVARRVQELPARRGERGPAARLPGGGSGGQPLGAGDRGEAEAGADQEEALREGQRDTC